MLAVAAAVAIGVGCSGEEAATPSGAPIATVAMGTSTPRGPTFYKDVLPILQQVCQDCHVPGGIGPFPLVTYQDTVEYAADIVKQTGSRTMPPWGAQVPTADCAPRFGFQDDLRLSDAQISTLGDWLEANTPEGDPADAPPPRPPPIAGLPGVSLQLTPMAPYTLQGTDDEFMCFVLDPKLTQTTYLNGTFIIAGNPEVVHHALVYADPDGQSKALADPTTGSYSCFGGPGISNTSLVTAWAPGGVPNELPPNAAMTLSAGTLLVMQVHYHPQSALAAAPDLTTFQMRFTPNPPQWQAVLALLGNYGSVVQNGTGLVPAPQALVSSLGCSADQFVIPHDTNGCTITQQTTIPSTLSGFPTPTFQLFAIGAHMHWVGVEERISIQRANPTATQPANECLLDVPKWDFYWQRGYNYDAAIEQLPTVNAGDVLTSVCTYNNTMGNPRLATALMQQGLSSPHDVSLGETTLDEMCLGVFGLLYQL